MSVGEILLSYWCLVIVNAQQMLAIFALGPNLMDLEGEVVTKNPYFTNKALSAKLLVT